MPFEVFRRHQRKLLAVFAIMAMFAFVLGDSLSGCVGRRGSGPGGPNDKVVAKLNWKTLHYSDLEPMKLQRQRANYFMAAVSEDPRNGNYFGGLTTRDLVDAVIYEHEAEALGLPATTDIANRVIRSIPGPRMLSTNSIEEVFRSSSLSQQITGEQLLLDIANQFRISMVARLPMTADATPLDIFDSYKSQQEKVSAYAVGINVEEFFDKLGTPTDADLRALFDSGKDRLPDPDGSLPAFKMPHKVRFEMAIADLKAIEEGIEKTIKPEEVRDAYKTRIAEFPADPGELPTAVFAGEPALTPHDSFPSVREKILHKLAEEKAIEQVDAKFDALRNEVLLPFSDRYNGLTGEPMESAANAPKPKPGDIFKAATLKAGLTYEVTPLVPSTTPELFGAIDKSHPPTDNPLVPTTPFAEIAFAAKTDLYEVLDLTDAVFRGDDGRRFLAWKIEDEAPRVPTFAEARPEVLQAWKVEKARPLAEAEAKKFAGLASSAGGGSKLRDVVGKRIVTSTDARPKMILGTDFRASMLGERRPVEITELPHAGDEIRDAIYGLTETAAVVAPNEPKTVYYVLTQRTREEANFDLLFGMGAARGLYIEAGRDSLIHSFQEWRQTLRERAGLPADWTPPDGK